MDEVLEFMKKAGVYYLGTLNGGEADIRPFGTVTKFEDKLYIQTGKVKNVSRQIDEHPRVCICAFADGIWLRLYTTLVDDARIEAQQALLDEYPGLSERYAAGDGNNQVLYMTDTTATFSSFTSEPRTIEF